MSWTPPVLPGYQSRTGIKFNYSWRHSSLPPPIVVLPPLGTLVITRADKPDVDGLVLQVLLELSLPDTSVERQLYSYYPSTQGHTAMACTIIMRMCTLCWCCWYPSEGPKYPWNTPGRPGNTVTVTPLPAPYRMEIREYEPASVRSSMFTSKIRKIRINP